MSTRHYPRFDTTVCPSPVGCARSTYHRNLAPGDNCECCGTRIYVEPELDDSNAVYRIAQKFYVCQCPGGNQPCPHPDCVHEITPGAQYIDYIGESGFKEPGKSYCMPCGVAVWTKERHG